MKVWSNQKRTLSLKPLLPRQLNLLSILLLALITLAFFWRVPLQGRVLLPLDVLHTYEPWRSEIPGALGIQIWNSWRSDEIRQFYPFTSVVQQGWRQGQIPFWNPYNATGIPLLAHGYEKVFYPPHIVLLFLMSTAQTMSWGLILHTFLGAFFTYLFLRELKSSRVGGIIAAIVFVFGGYAVLLMPSAARFPGTMWLPLLFWTFERSLARRNWGWFIAGGAVLAMQVLAGHLQVVLYSLTGLGFYAFYRIALIWFDTKSITQALRPLLFVLLATVIGLGLTAFQVWPILELAGMGIRNEAVASPNPDSLTAEFEELANNLSSKTLLRLIIPDVFGSDLDHNPAQGFSHTVYMYFGLLPLFFIITALFSVHRRVVWGMIFIALLVWLVMFEIPPFYQLFALFYPSFEALGFYRAQMLIAFLGAVTAGLGADWLIRECPVAFIKMLFYGGLIAGGMLTAVIVGLAYATKYQQRFFWLIPSLEEVSPEPVYLLSSLIFGLLFLVAGLWLLWLWATHKISRSVFGTLVVTLIVCDLFLAHIDYVPAYDPAMLYPSTPSIAAMQELKTQNNQPIRMMSVNRLFWGNISTVFQLEDIQGYDSFLLKRYSDYLDLTNARADANFRIAAFEAKTDKFIDALNVKYIYAPRYKLATGDWVSLLTQVDTPQIESEHDYAGQKDEWIINGWSQSVLLAPTSSRITYRGFLQQPTQLETAIAIAPEEADQPGAAVTFEVYAHTSDGISRRLFSQELTAAADSVWQPVVVDLTDFTGQEVLLSLVTNNRDDAKWNAGWADPLLSDSSKVELLHYGPNTIYLNKNHLPRAWLVHQVIEVTPEDTAAAAERMSQPGFDPAIVAVIEGDLPAPVTSSEVSSVVEFVEYSPSASTITVDSSTPGLLVTSDIYYPGWQVTVNGQPQTYYATNIAMRGVYLPAGQHEVRFVYKSDSFRFGLYISIGTLIIICGALLLHWWSYRRSSLGEN